MKKLIISIAEKSPTSPAVIECDFQLSEKVDPAECLERLRGALFLTGSGMQGASSLSDLADYTSRGVCWRN
jgi:hypothetical protein